MERLNVSDLPIEILNQVRESLSRGNTVRANELMGNFVKVQALPQVPYGTAQEVPKTKPEQQQKIITRSGKH